MQSPAIIISLTVLILVISILALANYLKKIKWTFGCFFLIVSNSFPPSST